MSHDADLERVKRLDTLYELARTFDTPEAWRLYREQRAELDAALGVDPARVVPFRKPVRLTVVRREGRA